ncbi:MAG: type II toxin-antitoxin system HicA family toxin [Pseudomonadota bacterium]
MPSKSRPRLNSVNYRDVVKAFEKCGFKVVRQVGSHITMRKPGHVLILTVPAHKPVASGTLKALIRNAGITPEQFAEYL